MATPHAINSRSAVAPVHHQPPLSTRLRKMVGEIIFFGVTGIILILFLFVFVWMVMTAFKHPRDVTVWPPTIVFEPTLQNFEDVLQKTPFWTQTRNSAIVAFGSVTLGLLLGLPASYIVARYRFRFLSVAVLILRMMPTIIFMLPLFVLYQRTGLIDTHLGLILSHLILTLPLTVWVMIGFFEDVPYDLEEQARVDGATRWQAFWKIALPLSLPGMVVTVILSFIQSWNNFIFVLILGGTDTTTLPMAVFNFMGFELMNFGGIAAVATMLSLPIMILTIIVQRWLVQGLTMGAVKG